MRNGATSADARSSSYEAFSVTPDYDLAAMEPGQTLFDITCHVVLDIKEALETSQSRYRPRSWRITTTSFAAALACFYLQIPVGHVEAGLRTRDLYSPWPEEFNRQAVDIISKYATSHPRSRPARKPPR